MSLGSNAPRGIGGKGVSSLFFLFFLTLGLVFCGLVVREEIAAARTWTWRQIPCQILTSQVGEPDASGRGNGNFSFEVAYRYSYGGQS